MYRLLLFLPVLLFVACVDNGDGPQDENFPPVDFDRGEMLARWMDDAIIPAQTATALATAELATRLSALEADQGEIADSLISLRQAFQSTYLTYQRSAPFIFAEGEAIRLRERTNTYPTDPALITSAIADGDRNLELPSMTVAQGFPALEYLLFAGDDADQPPLVTQEGAVTYAALLARTLRDLHAEYLTSLENGRDAYVANDGNSATASIDRSVNDFIFYYEKFLRAGKVGIPAGVFSDDPLPDRAESRYAGRSKELFIEALDASADFFRNHGLSEYLDALGEARGGADLSGMIAAQFTATRELAVSLDDNFETQVETDNARMLALYDELQKNTVLLKVDMLQALGVNVDYVDADGD